MGFTRAHVDRASLSEKGPIRFIAATEGAKADGIDLRMGGAQLDRYRSNPIVGFGHSYGGRDNLPIGRAVGVTTEGNRLFIDVEFDAEDPFAVEVERKIRSGYMNAVSIGFAVTEWEDGGDSWRGGVASSWELHELSVVPVPMDSEAVAIAGRSFDVDALAKAIAAALALKAVEETPAPEPETPAREVLEPNAVRNLLAALTPEEGHADE